MVGSLRVFEPTLTEVTKVAVKVFMTNTSGHEGLKSREKVTLKSSIFWNEDGPLIPFICFRNSAEN